jgi:hypothetical protein
LRRHAVATASTEHGHARVSGAGAGAGQLRARGSDREQMGAGPRETKGRLGDDEPLRINDGELVWWRRGAEVARWGSGAHDRRGTCAPIRLTPGE